MSRFWAKPGAPGAQQTGLFVFSLAIRPLLFALRLTMGDW
jgi:hypothetical protein